MSRLPRLYVSGLPQMILQRGNNRLTVFVDEEDYRQYLQHLRESAREASVIIHAYVLMPDHIHILASGPNEDAIGNMMQRLGRRYVRYFNDRHNRTGTLWEGRYRSTVVEPDSHLLDCYIYIEQNPVRAGLVKEAAHYFWSSCRYHLGMASDVLISDHALFWALGNTPFERQAIYKQKLEEGAPSAKLEAIRYAAHRGWMLGNMPVTHIQAQPSRRVKPLLRGRPRSKEDK